MEKIYCKEELNSSNIYALLEDYFFKGTPETYNESDNKEQCGPNKNRSFNDIKALASFYFKGITDAELASAIATLMNEPNCLTAVYCPKIEALAFLHVKKNRGFTNFSNPFKDSFLNIPDFKGYNLENLEEISGIKINRTLFHNDYTVAGHELYVSTIEKNFNLDDIVNKRAISIEEPEAKVRSYDEIINSYIKAGPSPVSLDEGTYEELREELYMDDSEVMSLNNNWNDYARTSVPLQEI